MEALPHMIHFTGVHAGDVTLAVHLIESSSPSSSPLLHEILKVPDQIALLGVKVCCHVQR
jgi:hypothetical protein